MSAETNNISGGNKTLKEQYVPMEQRDSQNVKAAEFVKELGIIAAFTALGAVIGRFSGMAIEKKNIPLPIQFLGSVNVDRTVGTWLGGKIGAIYGIFRHWKKKEGQHLGVEAINSDINTVLSPEALEKDVKKQAEIIDSIEKLNSLRKASTGMSHAENILAQREAATDANLVRM